MSVKIIQNQNCEFSRLVFVCDGVRHDVLVWSDGAVYISGLIMLYGNMLNLSDKAAIYSALRDVSYGYHKAMEVF